VLYVMLGLLLSAIVVMVLLIIKTEKDDNKANPEAPTPRQLKGKVMEPSLTKLWLLEAWTRLRGRLSAPPSLDRMA